MLSSRPVSFAAVASVAARAGVDVAIAVAVAVVALARLLRNTSDHGTCNAADSRTDSGTPDIARGNATDDGAGGSADAGTSFRLGAACDRKADQHQHKSFLHLHLSKFHASGRAGLVLTLRPAARALPTRLQAFISIAPTLGKSMVVAHTLAGGSVA